MPDPFSVCGSGRLLHIGPQKTGSTTIQLALRRSGDLLREHDIAYFRGAGPDPRHAARQLAAVTEGRRPEGDLPAWDDLVRQVRECPRSRALISDETYGKLQRRGVARVVRDLGADLHVVAFARRYDKYLPSQWQQRVKFTMPATYEEWLGAVLRGDDARLGRYDHRIVDTGHDTVRLVERWLEFIPPEQFTLVIGSETDRAWLFTVFEQMLRLPEGSLHQAGTRWAINSSMPLAATEFFRLTSAGMLDAGYTRREARARLRPMLDWLLAHGGQVPGPKNPPLPDWAVPLIEDWSRQRVEGIRALPVRVLGDPSWLLPEGPETGTVGPQELPVDYAARAMARVLSGEPGATLPAEGLIDPDDADDHDD